MRAVSTITDRLKQIIDEQGAQSILTTHYSGTLSLIALLFPLRFFFRLGSTEVSGDTICNAAGHQAWKLLFGESYVGFDPRTAKDSQCILVWGAKPSRILHLMLTSIGYLIHRPRSLLLIR